MASTILNIIPIPKNNNIILKIPAKIFLSNILVIGEKINPKNNAKIADAHLFNPK
jgi:hypothetical protein